MTPRECIADLDAALATDGEQIVLQRMTLGPGNAPIAFSVHCLAFVRGYEPNEMVGGITQQDSRVIISPTEIVAAGWTSGKPANEDRRVPMKGNKAVIAGKVRNVEAAVGKYVGGELVRIEMRVLG
jgi:hypothetical protein